MVIAAHHRHVTRNGLQNMFPSQSHERMKLIGTVIITSPSSQGCEG